MKKALGFAGVLVLLASFLTGCDLEPEKGRIQISSTPTGAQLYVNGKPRGTTPAVVAELTAGNYLVELRKEGFERTYKAATLLSGQDLTMDLKMNPVNGLVLVESDPAGADVVIEGVSKGFTPLLITDLPLGSYEMELSSSDQLPKTVQVDVETRLPQRVMVKLLSNAAQVTVTSDPVGAEVRLNGVLVGETPVLMDEVKAGEALISVSKRGYKPFERTMVVEATRTYELPAKLEALPSGLSIATTPGGAAVVVDNKPVGETPLNLSDLQEGPHEVTVSLIGYASQTKAIYLEPNINESLEFELKKDSGELVLDTEPALVQVYLDGELVATTEEKDESDSLSKPLTLTLKAGEQHAIQLVRDGFVAKALNVTPNVDQVIAKHEVLRRIFVYDTKITTRENIIKCRLEYKLPNGDLYYERFPGVFDTARASDIVKVEPISLDSDENRQARKLMEASKAVIEK